MEAPTGDFVPFGEMCYDALNRFGYVEPVATVAYVESDMLFSGARLQTVVHEQLPV